jgi:hypothetical protein
VGVVGGSFTRLNMEFTSIPMVRIGWVVESSVVVLVLKTFLDLSASD